MTEAAPLAAPARQTDEDVAAARRERAWRALSFLFAGTAPDYPGIARALRGFSLDEIRDILFHDVAPVCGLNLLGPEPPILPAMTSGTMEPSAPASLPTSLPTSLKSELVDAIRSGMEARLASRPAALKSMVIGKYLAFYFRDLWNTVEEKLPEYWAATKLTPSGIAELAHRAMLAEAGASPKPGLVCPDHNGAHRDMNFASFVASADALLPYLETCAFIGTETKNDEPETVFAALRKAGVKAEKAMFAATGGVNTHKGLVFSMGLLCAATGRRLARKLPLWPEDIARDAATFIDGIVERDLGGLTKLLPLRPLTAGEKLFLEHGETGIRGEAEKGFPTALGAYNRLNFLYESMPYAQALPQTLLWLMATSPDTNILSRGGAAGLAFVRGEAANALAAGGMETEQGRERVMKLRDDMTERNLSPGGSADLLALAIFFRLLQDADYIPATYPATCRDMAVSAPRTTAP